MALAAWQPFGARVRNGIDGCSGRSWTRCDTTVAVGRMDRVGDCHCWTKCGATEGARRVVTGRSRAADAMLKLAVVRGGAWSVGAAGVCGMGVPRLIDYGDDRAAVKAT